MPELVTIHRTADALEAEILGDLLVEEGIEARVLGARVGAAPLALASEMEARIDVPARDAGEARRIVAEHLAAVRVAPEPEDDDEPRDPPRLNPLLAAGVIGICPGGAHFYARRPLLAMAIGLGEVAAVVMMAARGGAAAAVVLCVLLVVDLVGGQLAVRAWNRGVRLSPVRQAVRGALVLLGATAMATVAGPWLERPLAARRGRTGMQKEMRAGAGDPRQLPFPLHLDFRR